MRVRAVALDPHGGPVGLSEEGIPAAAAAAAAAAAWAQGGEGTLVGVVLLEVGQVLDVQRQLRKVEEKNDVLMHWNISYIFAQGEADDVKEIICKCTYTCQGNN